MSNNQTANQTAKSVPNLPLSLPLNPLAQKLNQSLEAESKVVLSLLSNKGRAIFFPSGGIIAQAAEAKEKAKPEYNATAGIATDKDGPLVFPSVYHYFNDLKKNEVFVYSPSSGNLELRKLWQERIREINPSLQGKRFSLPVVAGGLTSSLSTVADMFFDEGDEVIIPDQLWGNYKLMLEPLRSVKINYFPFFAEDKFNLAGFKASLEETLSKPTNSNKVVKLILNFPNNPTGYSPTKSEQQEIVDTLKGYASAGNKILVILDEAYHTMFYEEEVIEQSFFSYLLEAHENILTIKICGATKEFFVWGLRVGFVTYGIKNGSERLYDALEKKTAGVIRANISNVSTSAQNILGKILKDKSYKSDAESTFEIMRERFLKVKEVLRENQEKYREVFTAYPFNSGYFMLLRLNDSFTNKGLTAEDLRKELLDKAQIGTISTAQHDLRVAFSCLSKENIPHVFEKIYEVGQGMLK